jgi:predicted hydrocarbon binding protein
MLEFLEQNFGTAGRSMMFQMGYVGGINESRKILNNLKGGQDWTKRELIEHVSKELGVTGIHMKVTEFDAEKGVVKIVFHNSVFEPMCLRMELPQCFWLRGFLTGMISEVTGMKLVFNESECYAHGDPDCSIRMTRDARPVGTSAQVTKDLV